MTGMRSPRGFTVIEVLIAMAIVMSIAGALAQVVPSARHAFDRVPAELDLQQRGRAAVDALSQALRSSAHYAITSGPALTALIPVPNGAQGRLDVNTAPGAALTLAVSPCPNVKDVCGFTRGMTVLVGDPAGLHDVMIVASTVPGSRSIAADRTLARSYAAGTPLIEIDQFTFSLAGQPDGSRSLIRQTAAGAIQPMVDFVSALAFSESDRQVDVTVSVQATTAPLRRVVTDRVFRASIAVRSGS